MKPSRDQRQAVHRWNRFVLGEDYIQQAAKLHPKSKEEKKRHKNEFDLVTAVHEAEYENVKTPPEPAHRFTVSLESNDFTEEKYTLFEQYQRLVHKDPPDRTTRSGFRRFLCESPLKPATREVDGQTRHFGSFHQCYRLDGQLIAIGVIDLLPRAVSAVYFIYDVAYEKWSFGKLSALREAALALEGGHQYYNMGFYIHSCAKMRYKCDYKPQYILDPDTYEWAVLDDEVAAKLDGNKFVSLSREREQAERDTQTISESSPEEHRPADPAEKFATPVEAEDSGLSLFDFGFPGIMSAAAVERELELDWTIVAVGKGEAVAVPAMNLVSWDEGAVTAPFSVKGMVAELAACVGPKVAKQMVVDFTR